MKHIDHEYTLLNDLAERGGVVIFGGSDDMNIPLCELKQAFTLNSALYNRSIPGLSVSNVCDDYDRYVAPLCPECILLHIGAADRDLFSADPEAFDKRMHEAIRHMRAHDKKCEIAIISHKNPDNDACIAAMNKHLQYIAESERCEYGDITTKRVWNPRETQSAVSFVYSLGFVRPLKNKHPLGDIIKILFCSFQPQAC